jgi:hypothetical protein
MLPSKSPEGDFSSAKALSFRSILLHRKTLQEVRGSFQLLIFNRP